MYKYLAFMILSYRVKINILRLQINLDFTKFFLKFYQFKKYYQFQLLLIIITSLSFSQKERPHDMSEV
ncbi:hypothetical protein A9Q97_04895 [Rhodospirillales bacterium 47_12_T64]|nr:hypothetical protein A9Q97_04895 [Rhodospirillales bacterium 47_12_T64]